MVQLLFEPAKKTAVSPVVDRRLGGVLERVAGPRMLGCGVIRESKQSDDAKGVVGA
jgi:hypothetical protein